jgi:hypothetical protein
MAGWRAVRRRSRLLDVSMDPRVKPAGDDKRDVPLLRTTS